MTAEAIESHKLDIGRVLGGTFQVIGRNFVTFAILGLVLSGLPTGVIAFIQASWLGGQVDELAAGNINLGMGYFTNIALVGLAALITTAILQGALIFATVQDMNGQKPQVGEALATGLRSFLPLIVVSILFALAVGFGMILLIVPGVMIACAWCVAVPSLVADRTGIFAAFSRSADLTRGNRWRVFGLFLVLFVILLVLGSVLGAITTAVLFSTPSALDNPFAAALNPINIVIQVIQQTISAVLGATLTAVLYVELRRAREGAAPQWLADIFS
jgi:hypothetical protein